VSVLVIILSTFASKTAGLRRFLLALLAVSLFVGAPTLRVSGSETWLYMNSDCGDFQGNGGQYYYNGTNSPYSFSGFGGQAMLEMGGWELDFGIAGLTFTNGTYAAGYGWPDNGANTIAIFGSTACAGGSGTFEVLQSAYDTNNNLTTLWLKFDQKCDSDPGDLHGEMRINVSPPMEINVPRSVTVVRDQPLAFTAAASSTNGTHVTLSFTGTPAGASFIDNGDNTATFQWTPTWNQIGNFTMVIHAVDTEGVSADAPVDIVVLPQNGVTSLVVDVLPSGQTNYDQAKSLISTSGPWTVNGFRGVFVNYHGNIVPTWNLAFGSADCSPLQPGTYVDASSSFAMTANQGTSSVSGYPANSDQFEGCGSSAGVFLVKQIVRGFPSGIVSFRASFEQDCGDTIFGEFNYNADAPVILQAPFTAFVAAGQALTCTVAAADSGNHPLTMTATNLPEGAAFQDNGNGTGTLFWTPHPSQFGTFYALYRAENTIGEFDTALTKITISPPTLLVYGVEKGRLFNQKSTGLAQPIKRADGYEFSAFTVSPTNGTVQSAMLHIPSGQTQQLLPSDPVSYLYGATAASEFALDSIFPDGLYAFDVTTPQTNVTSPSVTMPHADFPSAPHVNNLPAAQVINPSQDFTLTWDAFPGGTTNDSVEVGIYDSDGADLLYQTPTIGVKGALSGVATAVVIPSNTLVAGQSYIGAVGFVHPANIDKISYPLGTGYGLRTTLTGFEMKTTTGARTGNGKVKFSSSLYVVSSNVGTATVSLVRSGGNTVPCSMDYKTIDGTAQSGIDFTSVSGTLIFSNDVTSQAFTIPIMDTGASGAVKTVTLLLGKSGLKFSTKATLRIVGN
jgi:Calx-beta domain/Putative Ig domain